MSSSSCDCRSWLDAVKIDEGNYAPRLQIHGLAIVQKADSSSLFDDLDAALQSGASEKRAAMLRQVTDPFLSDANHLSEETVALPLLWSASPGIIKPPLSGPRDDGLLILCRAADLQMGNPSAPFSPASSPPGPAPKPGHRKPKIDSSRPSKSNAQRLLRFRQVREVSAKSA
jgi:hypothetical protein